MLTVGKVTHYNNPKILAEVSESLGEAMVGLTMYGHSSDPLLLTAHCMSIVIRTSRAAVWPNAETKSIRHTNFAKHLRDLR